MFQISDAHGLPNMEAHTVVTCLGEEFVVRHCVPLHCHSDQGTQFESHLFKEMCDILGIKKTHTTAFFPQSDGLVEQMNRTYQDMLSKCVSDNQKDWDTYLPLLNMAYNSAKNKSTGYSPYELMTGRQMRLPADLLLGWPEQEEPPENNTEYADQLQAKLDYCHEIAQGFRV